MRALGVSMIGALTMFACKDAAPEPPAATTNPAPPPAPTVGPLATDAVDTPCELGKLEPCQRACDAGVDDACEQVAMMFIRGVGVPRSQDKAAEHYRKLCEGGRRRKFCPSFAFALAEGNGVAPDRARARALFTETCALDPTACSEYGSLYVGGTRLKRDPEMAHFLLDLACKSHDARACYDLTVLDGGGPAHPPRDP